MRESSCGSWLGQGLDKHCLGYGSTLFLFYYQIDHEIFKSKLIKQIHNKEFVILYINPSSTGKCRNYKVGRRDPGLNPGPHSCV